MVTDYRVFVERVLIKEEKQELIKKKMKKKIKHQKIFMNYIKKNIILM
jgi:transcription antitermination factor NusG